MNKEQFLNKFYKYAEPVELTEVCLWKNIKGKLRPIQIEALNDYLEASPAVANLCFRNACDLAFIDRDILYVQGFIVSSDTPYVVKHAWNIIDGIHVDISPMSSEPFYYVVDQILTFEEIKEEFNKIGSMSFIESVDSIYAENDVRAHIFKTNWGAEYA